MMKILLAVVAVAFVAIVAFLVIDPNLAQNQPGITLSSSINENSWIATIEGEVNKAGTYVLSEGATMGDLISVAGGTTANADELSYFDEASLTKGLTYYIPPKYDTTSVCSTEPIEKVNINSDSQEVLMNVNGFTSSIASAIVSYRNDNGSFYTIEALTEVYGIGNATYKKVRNYVTLHN